MFPERLRFYVIERANTFAPDGKEYALNVEICGSSATITTWNQRPSDTEVQRMIDVAMRSIEIYLCFIKLPNIRIRCDVDNGIVECD